MCAALVLLLLLFRWPLPAPVLGEPGVRDWQEASHLERILQSRPADAEDARRKLLAWYTLHYRDLRAGRRVEHILWTIRNQPDLRLSDSRSLRIEEHDPAFAEAAAAWEAQVRRRPDNPAILLRAAEHLLRAKPERAEALLERVRKQARARLGPDGLDPPPPGGHWWTWSWADGEVTRLQARLYVDALLGVTARSPWEAPSGLDPQVAQSPFAGAARRKLDSSGDGRLLAEAAWWLHLAEQGRGQPSPWGVSLAWSWLQRAERLDPGSHAVAVYQDAFQQYWSRQQPARVPAPLRRVRRTGANTPQPIFAVRPACPGAAHAAAPPEGFEVGFRLILRPDGTVRFALLEGAHPAAIRPAAEAVRQWRFAPQSDGSSPVETETRVRLRVCGPQTGE